MKRYMKHLFTLNAILLGSNLALWAIGEAHTVNVIAVVMTGAVVIRGLYRWDEL